MEPTQVQERAVSFTSIGDMSLTGTWFIPAATAEPAIAVIVAGGAGVLAHSYRHLARHLALRGAAVLTFDYRGVGQSQRGDLRQLVARTEEWSADVDAALEHARRAFPDAELTAVAHSVGTSLLGAAPLASQLIRAVLMGPHTAYWGDYLPGWRWPMKLMWHVLMPMITNAVGYFPGKALHLGEDIPRGIALDWANRRRPDVLCDDEAERRFAAALQRYHEVTAHTLALTISDDAFATALAAQRLLSYYPKVKATHEVVEPKVLGFPRLGHFGFIRKTSGPYFWDKAAHWLRLAS